MSAMQLLSTKLQALRYIFNTIRPEKKMYRYSLVNVSDEFNNSITLFVLVTGIKKQILKFQPEEIVYDDELLSEFSPCDVRAITYLSFQKYIKYEISTLHIEGQFIKKGITIFDISNLDTNERILIDARTLYQQYDYLTKLSKKDMISVIATAVQEQTISDIKKMGGI